MNSKKINRAFLVSIILYILLLACGGFFFPLLFSNIIVNNILCEAVIALPVLITVALSKEKMTRFLGFKKIKLTSLLAVIPFTMFSMPLITLVNLISQFWVRNEAVAMMEGYQVTELPFVLMLLSVGVFAPFCEEAVCRGAYYRGYRKSGSAFKAMLLSSLLFALVHMNINQALYAFVMGILAVLLVEATGSLWASVFYHCLINSSQVAILYGTLKLNPLADSGETALSGNLLLYSVGVYLLITAVTLPLAWALLVWISQNEGRKGILPSLWRERKYKKDKMVTVSLIPALILCAAVMIGTLAVYFLPF